MTHTYFVSLEALQTLLFQYNMDVLADMYYVYFHLICTVIGEVLRDADNIIIPVKKPCSIFYQPRKETFDRNPNIKHPRDKIFLIIHKTMGQFESELQHTLFEM